ncbi:hypothetical protein MNBD_NITROSPINAE01-370 [hydrothermal vent metagenome]|uniref:Uncharacterized protein n=1 Tax=hydrothermal vent metagenome TaxID=652676 RepID=A0A3B1D4C9_9ZZZZ
MKSMGLANNKLVTGQSAQRLGLASRKHKVSTSIAEGAIFIPKPHKRVDFKLTAPEFKLLGSASKAPEQAPPPIMGADAGSGKNIASGDLGINGLTARLDSQAWQGTSRGYDVNMDVDYTPEKQSDVIVTQEEGRQVNNRQIHFTQQYDSYGRPRIGFSREPYDFAASKFVSVTSQIAFQENMASIHEQYNQYLIGPDNASKNPALMGQGDGQSQEVPVFGSTSGDQANGKANLANGDYFLGAKFDSGDSGLSAKEAFEAQRGGSTKKPPEDMIIVGKGKNTDMAEQVFGGGDIDTGKSKVLDVSV